jgi:hypothetical protein
MNNQQQEEAVPEDRDSDSTVNQESLWLWCGDSLGTQEEERPPLEAGVRGLVWDSRPRGPNACVVNCSSDSAI